MIGQSSNPINARSRAWMIGMQAMDDAGTPVTLRFVLGTGMPAMTVEDQHKGGRSVHNGKFIQLFTL
jgi:hypothetical protein